MYRALIVSSDSKFLSQTKKFITNINSSITIETLNDPSKIRNTLMSAGHVDVIVCDHNPPAIDAVTIFSEMTRMNDLRPFIITTEHADGDVAIVAFELKMDYYLSRENIMNFYMDLASKIVLCSERRRLELERALNERRMKALMNLVMMREREFGDILDYALEESVTLTNSTVGYIAMYEEETKKLKMSAWSRGGLDRCKMEDRQIVYDFDSTGLWGEPIRQNRPMVINDYLKDAKKKGTPAGHVPLNRLMMIPIYHNGKVLATAGVGNKAQEYTSDDLMQFTLLMDGLISIYHERMLEGENIKSERNLKEILQNAPVGIMIVDNEMSVIVENDYAGSMLSVISPRLPKESLRSGSNELSCFIAQDIEKVRDSGHKLEFEHTVGQEDYDLVFKINIARTKGKNNDDAGFIIIIDDVSESVSAGRQHITAVERINLLDALINDDIRKFLASIEEEMRSIPPSPSADSIRKDIGALKEIMAFVEEYHDVGIQGPQWQHLEDVLRGIAEADGPNGGSVEYSAKGVRILADPSFCNVFSQLISYSRAGNGGSVSSSVKCRLEGGDLMIRYADNGAGIPYEKKDDFISGMTMGYGKGIYLAFNILKACGFRAKELGTPGKGMVLDISVPASKYSVSWE